MRQRITRAYHLAVLWWLSVAAQGVVESIYRHGHEDGCTELREFMCKTLQQLHDDLAKDRATSYAAGFGDGMRARVFEAHATTAPQQRVM